MVGLAVQRGAKFCLPSIVFFPSGDYWGIAVSPTQQSFPWILPLSSRLLSSHGNLLPWQQQGTQLTIWRVDPRFHKRSIPADTHRHSHMQEHTLWQGSTDPDTLWHIHTHTHTNGIRPLCPAVSQHSPGGHLLVVPCPRAHMPHDWFISSRTLFPLVEIWCSLSLWRGCGFKFCPTLEICCNFT